MADFLSDNTTWLAVVLGLVAVAYGIGLTVYLLRQPAGDERMRSIAAAIQEGAQAYLTRQYTIIAGVAAVLFLLIGFLGEAVNSSAPRLEGRHRLPDRRRRLGGGRLHRHERLGARQRADRRGGEEGPRAGARHRLQGRRGHRAARGGPRPAGGGRLLPDPRRGRQRRRAPGRPRLRRQPHQRLRAARRRHLHQGRRRRRRPGGQGRGRDPRGRPAQPGGDRRQRRRQRRRLRRHGRRPLRDLRGHHGGRDVPRLAVPRRLRQRPHLPAGHRRRLDHHARSSGPGSSASGRTARSRRPSTRASASPRSCRSRASSR